LGAFKLEQFPSQKVVGITFYHYYDEKFQTQLNENWNHVELSSSKSGKLSLYINGDLKGVLDTNHLENFECPLGWIGGGVWGNCELEAMSNILDNSSAWIKLTEYHYSVRLI
jgi:hypothetical protein